MTDTLTAVLAAILNSGWQAILIVLLAMFALRFMPRINGATRYMVWWAVLAVVIALPMAPWVATRLKKAPAVAEAPLTFADAAPAPLFVGPVQPAPAVIEAPATRAALEVRAGKGPVVLFGLWGFVMVMLLCRIGWSYLYLRGVKDRARPAPLALRQSFDEWILTCKIRRPVRLMVSKEVSSPMAAGFLHPAVIVPESLLDAFTAEELDHVLVHELAHIARRDDWTNLLARLAVAVVTLHPIAAWALRRIDQEREIACDDWVVSVTGEARPYAASLARLFELRWSQRRMALAAGMAERPSHLRVRIENLLQRQREFAARVSVVRVVASVLALFALAMVCARSPRWIAFAQSSRAAVATPEAEAAAEAPEPAQASTAAPAARPSGGQTRAPAPASAPAAAPAPAASRNGSLLSALVAAGYGDLSVDEIIELKNQGVSAEFIDGMNRSGWGKLTTKQLVELKVQGTSPEYVRKIREAGIKDITLADVIQMKIHGVSPEWIREIHALGVGPYTAKQVVEFKIHGVSADLFRALKDAGFSQLDPRDIVEAKIHGLRADDIREARTYGSNLTFKQIIKLKTAGVI